MKVVALSLFFVLLALSARSRLNPFTGIFLIMCFLFTANPAVKKKTSDTMRPLGISLDTSKSMSVGDNGGSQRIEKAKKTVLKNIKEIKKYFNVSFYVFDADYKAVSEKDFFAAWANGSSSAIRKCAENISSSLPQDGVLLLLSDGRDNVSSGRNFLKPVYAVGCAEGAGYSVVSDIGVEILSYPEKSFQDSPASVTVKLRRSGKIKACILTFRRSGRVLAKKEVVFEEEEYEKTVDADFLPGEPQMKALFEVLVLPQDAFSQNNRASFRMSVFKSRIKIMFISGRPGWEYRNIRALIKTNPKIDLTSFVILRNPEDYIPFPENKLSLIPFPVAEIFLKDIYNYDLVILLNFDYRRFISPDYLNPLAKHIQGGGGLLIIGGENAFTGGNYFSSPLGELLPVKALKEISWESRTFRIKANETHPITTLIADIPGISGIELSGINTGVAAKEDAQTLLTSSVGEPVAVCAAAGKGRVMTIFSNGLWNFFFARQETGYFFQEFFRNSIAWLTGSPLLDEISLSGKESYKVAENLKLDVRVKNLKEGHLKARHFFPGGSAAATPVMESTERFNVSETLLKPGAHRVEIELLRDGMLRTRAKSVFKFDVEEESIEDENTSADFENLKDVARISGGGFFLLDDFKADEIRGTLSRYPEYFYPARTTLFLVLFVMVAAALWYRENT
ncbi:MAG: hypothetical protein COT16_01860 [Elusimicrobia bacterium CG08_land_8_20_14_0_20_44_26]|nr:MAG: hypothetical protein COT16_01860 [Elusimicrobia bacterium CG08_land_8_20_14_0_20_44_26]